MRLLKEISVAALCIITYCVHAENPLRLNLEKDSSYLTTSDNDVKIAYKGQNKTIHEVNTLGLKVTVKSNNEKNAELYCQYTAIAQNKYLKDKNGNDSIITSDTRQPRTFLARVFLSMIGKQFYATLNHKGIIQGHLNGIEILDDSLFKHIYRKVDEPTRMIFTYKANQMAGENITKGELESITSILPDSSIKPGGVWTVKSHYLCGMKAAITTTYTLIDDNGTICTIKGKATIGNDSTTAVYSINGIGVHLTNLKGSADMTYTLDRKNGWIKNGTINVTCNTDVKLLNIKGEESNNPTSSAIINIDRKVNNK